MANKGNPDLDKIKEQHRQEVAQLEQQARRLQIRAQQARDAAQKVDYWLGKVNFENNRLNAGVAVVRTTILAAPVVMNQNAKTQADLAKSRRDGYEKLWK